MCDLPAPKVHGLCGLTQRCAQLQRHWMPVRAGDQGGQPSIASCLVGLVYLQQELKYVVRFQCVQIKMNFWHCLIYLDQYKVPPTHCLWLHLQRGMKLLCPASSMNECPESVTA